jgi:hypothetical protein
MLSLQIFGLDDGSVGDIGPPFPIRQAFDRSEKL